MITSYDVYKSYRNNSFKKPKRLPSEEKYRNRMTETTLLQIDKCAGYFNTVYSNIDIDMYMKCGFGAWKTFTYKHFMNPIIIEKYKNQDKRIKRTVKTSNNRIFDSFQNIEIPLLNYCKLLNIKQKLILSDYIKGKIDTIIVVYCIHHKLISFTDIEEDYLYNIYNNYNKWVKLMFRYEEYIEELDKERRFEDT